MRDRNSPLSSESLSPQPGTDHGSFAEDPRMAARTSAGYDRTFGDRDLLYNRFCGGDCRGEYFPNGKEQISACRILATGRLCVYPQCSSRSGQQRILPDRRTCRAVSCFPSNVSRVSEVIQLGAYIQLNGDSIVGKNGLRMKLFAQKLMKKELVHFVASDMHHMESRRPNLKECAEYMEKTYGFARTKELLYDNPRKLIENKLIEEL